jgi:hypothetical protein
MLSCVSEVKGLLIVRDHRELPASLGEEIYSVRPIDEIEIEIILGTGGLEVE